MVRLAHAVCVFSERLMHGDCPQVKTAMLAANRRAAAANQQAVLEQVGNPTSANNDASQPEQVH